MTIDNDRCLSGLIFGAGKAGKSTLSVTGPAPRLLMDVESASRFLSSPRLAHPIKPIKWNPANEKPPIPDGTWDTAVVATRDWATVEKAYQWLASGRHPFRSFIIDSISELQNRYIEQTSGRKQATTNQWGDVYRTVGGLVRDIRDLTMHPTRPVECVIMTAMAKTVDGQKRAWCQGQLQTFLPYALDFTGYLYLDQEVDGLTGEVKDVRRLLTKVTDDVEAGERVAGAWPATIDNPNISKMIDMVFGENPKSNQTEESK